MLKTILMVTIMAANLFQVEQAYRHELDYKVVDRGVVAGDLAATWGSSAISGRRYVILQPSSNEPVYLRFIEEVADTMPEPMKTEGWNAVEILVQDVDTLAQALDRSAYFSVVGRPRYLTEKKNIKAMQAIGPADELLYFTNISDPEKSGFGLQPARSYIDRVFIMVVGTRDHDALSDYYRNTLGLPVTGPLPYRIGVLSRAYDLPVDTRHELSIAQLSERFLLELDRYPDSASKRNIVPGSLPPGIAMVSFEVEEWLAQLPYIGKPGQQFSFPYQGRRTGVIIGPAGEYLELVEGITTGAPHAHRD